ncbi:major facilitator superfamily domain-containing protein [Aspergillus coremiiformis]|uniref:Major facilitator superfamily domain-containing protein n=1 Tax=Aspergillus coremiiformis TaxID=138285 RepID=A0A5N6Z2D5_9EURO|nr:major facilitator superfamily domain-containing protein [Aspergillus coremiiformis]
MRGEDPERGSIDNIAFEGTPGTRVLIDQTDAEVIPLPHPTSSPDDPLNWGFRRKYTAQTLVLAWVFMLAAATLSTAVTYGPVIVELGASTMYLNVGAALSLLMLGICNLAFNPLALKFGRRHVYILSAIITAVSQVVIATCHTKATFIGGRILTGIGAAPFEQLPALSVDDQFFIHHRGFGLSLYTLALTMGSFLGPTATGFVVSSMGWRWVYWFYAIFIFAIAVLMFFGLEETGFPRHIHSGGNETEPHPPKTYWQKLKLMTPIPSSVSFWRTATNPFRLLADPIIWWCGIMYGFGVAWLTVMAVESTTIFTVYKFSPSSLGLTNLAPMIGAIFVVWVGGAGTDRFMVWKARKNGGIMEPETRLYSVFLAGPMMGAGLILYGVGAAHDVHWAGPIIGMGMIGSALPIAAEVSLGYVSESYPSLAGEATAAVISIRNVVGCGMTFAIAPWIQHNGLQNTFIAVGFLAFAVFYSGGLFIWKGKTFRRIGAKRYYAIVALKD